MPKYQILPYCRRTRLTVLAGLVICLQSPQGVAESLAEVQTTRTVVVKEVEKQLLPIEKRTNINYGEYILGPGDALEIEMLDLPELSGRFSIGPDGTIYLPRLRALYVEGLTVEELRVLLSREFSTYVREPQVYVRPVAYRPIRVYVGGEVKRPGYYTLTGVQSTDENTTDSGSASTTLFPTVFDAIRSAQGITPYTNLSQVQVTRKRAEGLGGGRIRTNLNFLLLITQGNESQNIRLFDGDTLNIGRSPIVLRDQLLKAGQTNLTPQFMEVFVSGRVNMPGRIKLPQGSSLNQAISLAGGVKLLKGRVEFLRFNREGTIERRIFAYKPGAEADAPNNPVLASGDLIRINESILSGSVNVINEVTGPFVGLYSVYSLFKDIAK